MEGNRCISMVGTENQVRYPVSFSSYTKSLVAPWIYSLNPSSTIRNPGNRGLSSDWLCANGLSDGGAGLREFGE